MWVAIPASLSQDQPSGWPQQLEADDLNITIYQPQVEKWENNRLLERAAVSVESDASSQPLFGLVWLTARTEVDKTTGLVTLKDPQVTRTSFPSAPERAGPIAQAIRSHAGDVLQPVSVERLQASLSVTRIESRRRTPALKNTPPKIIFETTPSLLVLIDGSPVVREGGAGKLLRIINTRALIMLDPGTGKYYLFLGDRWMTAAALNKPWKPAGALASALGQSLEQAKSKAVDERQVDLLEDLKGGPPPKIVVSTRPAELIQSAGDPQFDSVADTHLLYVRNSGNTIFLDTIDQNYYVLLSGRWYRSKTLHGPWAYESAKALPRDFTRIPQNHPKGTALASVAGTPEAQEAAISNEVPQTATVDTSQATLTVPFDGSPQFKPIEGTPLLYAANTQVPVIEVAPTSFYAIQNGVWFFAPSATGPWTVARSVPSVIYTIPPSSPLYYVTYAYVYGSGPNVVYAGYYPGYLGSYVAVDGVVVYGTGVIYPAWTGTFWFGAPVTFGCGFYWANPYGWGYGAGYWGGHGGYYGGVGVGVGVVFHPWWGPAGWRNQGVLYNQGHPGMYGHGGHGNVSSSNVYHNWNSGAVRNTWDHGWNQGGRYPHSAGYSGHAGGTYYRGGAGQTYRPPSNTGHQQAGVAPRGAPAPHSAPPSQHMGGAPHAAPPPSHSMPPAQGPSHFGGAPGGMGHGSFGGGGGGHHR